MKSPSIEELLSRLRRVKRSRDGWTARCPAHEDRTPSLSIKQGRDGRVLLHCFAGCGVESVVGALGLTLRDLFPDKREFSAESRSQKRSKDCAPRTNWRDLATRLSKNLTPALSSRLSVDLGVSEDSLRLINAGFATCTDLAAIGNRYQREAFTFPEFNARRQCVGISLRFRDGAKGFMKGGRRGLIVPRNLDSLPDPVLVVEGATDVAACLTAGCASVGRPSCNGGASYLSELLSNRDVLIVGENDRKSDGTWPGRDGSRRIADKLAQVWQRPVKVALPPTGVKDTRAWLQEALK